MCPPLNFFPCLRFFFMLNISKTSSKSIQILQERSGKDSLLSLSVYKGSLPISDLLSVLSQRVYCFGIRLECTLCVTISRGLPA